MNRIICLISITILLTSLLMPIPVNAQGSTLNLKWLNLSWDYWLVEDGWYNYDFDGGISEPDPEMVDWAIDILFLDNANCVKVKNMYYGNAWRDSTMKEWLDDGYGQRTHSDKGTKSGWPNGYHMRPYAPWNQTSYHMSNYYFGSYCIGSCHEDIWPLFCNEESTEHVFCNLAISKGYGVSFDYLNLGNYEPVRWEGTHCWDNDGWASLVDVLP